MSSKTRYEILLCSQGKKQSCCELKLRTACVASSSGAGSKLWLSRASLLHRSSVIHMYLASWQISYARLQEFSRKLGWYPCQELDSQHLVFAETSSMRSRKSSFPDCSSGGVRLGRLLQSPRRTQRGALWRLASSGKGPVSDFTKSWGLQLCQMGSFPSCQEAQANQARV